MERGEKERSIALRVQRGAALCLPAGAVVALAGSRGLEVVCLDGECWLTREGDRRDYRLRAGVSAPLDATGRLVLQALKTSRVRVRDRVVETHGDGGVARAA
jgi:hypothetical protein